MDISLTPECFVEAEELIREGYGHLGLEIRYLYAEEGSRDCPLCFSASPSGVVCESNEEDNSISLSGLVPQHRAGMNVVMEVYAYGRTQHQLFTEGELESIVDLKP